MADLAIPGHPVRGAVLEAVERALASLDLILLNRDQFETHGFDCWLG